MILRGVNLETHKRIYEYYWGHVCKVIKIDVTRPFCVVHHIDIRPYSFIAFIRTSILFIRTDIGKSLLMFELRWCYRVSKWAYSTDSMPCHGIFLVYIPFPCGNYSVTWWSILWHGKNSMTWQELFLQAMEYFASSHAWFVLGQQWLNMGLAEKVVDINMVCMFESKKNWKMHLIILHAINAPNV